MKTALLKTFIIVAFLSGKIHAQIISTIVGTGTAGYSGDWGAPNLAEINYPGFLSFGGYGFGSLYVSDRLNYRVRVVKLGAGGIIYTMAGDGTAGFSGDGGPATTAQITIPGGVCIDHHSNTFFADYDNHCIRKVDMLGIITTYGGIPGVAGYSGDGGLATAAEFDHPNYVVVDSVGNLFIADQYNHRIRKIDTAHIITTVAGTGTSGSTGDGGSATAAEISYPNYVRMDKIGNLYITDNGHHKIRKINTSGIINTIAGNGILGSSGDGGPATEAELNFPGGIAFDSHGNVLICDCFNNKIRRIDTITGIINTIAGTGIAGDGGDGGSPLLADLNQPVDITVDNYNNIYFVDWNNNRIRMITAIPDRIIQNNSKLDFLKIFPNPTLGSVFLEGSENIKGDYRIIVSDLYGRVLQSLKIENFGALRTNLDLSDLEANRYWVTLSTNEEEKSFQIMLKK